MIPDSKNAANAHMGETQTTQCLDFNLKYLQQLVAYQNQVIATASQDNHIDERK